MTSPVAETPFKARPGADTASHPMPDATPSIRTVCVVGLGAMGRGIAEVCLRAGLSVVLHDADPSAGRRALDELSNVRATCGQGCDSRPVTGFNAPTLRLAASLADLANAEFADVDLAIEAVPENLELKRRVLSDIEAALRPTALLATNTSSLRLASLAGELRHPARFCGLHFCYPATERALLELVVGTSTDAGTLVSAERFARRLGKQSVRVGDAPGFVLNRLLSFYLNEALELLLEGVEPELLHDVALSLGMPSGPLSQLDQYGLDVGLAVGRTMLTAFPDRAIPSELLIAVCKAQRREGRSRPTFLDSSEESAGGQNRDHCNTHTVRSAGLDPSVRRIIAERRRVAPPQTFEDVGRRLMLPVVLEATRILDERLIESWERIDLVLRLGLGMTSAFRGLLDWTVRRGASELLEWLAPRRPLGERYAPTPWLLSAREREQRRLTRAAG